MSPIPHVTPPIRTPLFHGASKLLRLRREVLRAVIPLVSSSTPRAHATAWSAARLEDRHFVCLAEPLRARCSGHARTLDCDAHGPRYLRHGDDAQQDAAHVKLGLPRAVTAISVRGEICGTLTGISKHATYMLTRCDQAASSLPSSSARSPAAARRPRARPGRAAAR